MPEFQRKTVPFLHRGMNWNSPVEKLQDGQVSWAKNVRVLEQGTVSSAHGHTLDFDGIPANYLHSISRLNVLSQATEPGGVMAFDQNLRRTYVLGADQNLYVFQDQATLANASLNPVRTPQAATNGFSGNPLSIIDVEPAGAAVAWKYIADSKQMVTVGYYPGDAKGSQMARCLQIGLPVPVSTSIPTMVSGGNLLGGYQWAFAYRNIQTGARSNPSAATRANTKYPATRMTSDGTPTGTSVPFHVTLQLPSVPLDPQAVPPAADTHIVVDVYRFGGNILRWALVGTGAGGSTFTDDTPDLNLLAAPSPPQVTDASTGLTRFNLYQPFVTQDIRRQGSGTLSQQGTINVPGETPPVNRAIWTLNDNNHAFKTNWIPGSTIYVNGQAFSIYQVWSDNIIELAQDLNGVLTAGAVTWSTNAGTLMSGQPLPHIWGPYGVGQSGSYVFACGDPNARGTLYWTNGNDPDSTDIVNNIVVTSPSEKLVTGAVYDGQPYCWSTERQFQIFPSLTIFGQFTTQEVAGAKGVWLEWSLSVQSNGLADQSVSWRGKDGIYDWSAGGGLVRLTDPLYSFFPHDNNPGIAPEGILPFIGTGSHHPESVGSLDDTLPKYHRLCWFQGLLYYDFVANIPEPASPNVGISNWSTLIWDSVNIPGGGWVSLDQPFASAGKPETLYPIVHGIDIGANDPAFDATPQTSAFGPIYGPMSRGGSLKVLWGGPSSLVSGGSAGGGTIFDYYGLTRGFESRFMTRAEDAGDPRLMKLWGDYWIDCTPLAQFTVYPLASFNTLALEPRTVPVGPSTLGVRMQFPLDFLEFVNAGGWGLLSPTLGLDVIWVGNSGQFAASLNEWQPTFVIKPELIEFRATDRDDQGLNKAKYLMGCNIEADTREFIDPTTGLPLIAPNITQTINVNVIVDNNVVATLTLYHPGQTEKPYGFEPVAGYEFQVQFQFETQATVWWQLYKVSWIFEPWPDDVARKYPFTNLGDTSDKFIQGIVLPMETGGKDTTVGVWFDDSNQTEAWTKSTLPLKKTGVVLDMPQPIIAHFIQFQTVTPGRIWPEEAKVVWEPVPELTNTWQTQETDHDLATWHHLRDCFIAYMGNGDAPVLEIDDEYETMRYTLDPAAVNQFVRAYRVLKPMKAKWHRYRVTSVAGIRLYVKDTVVRLKEWGSTGPYLNAQPFGDLSRASGARM